MHCKYATAIQDISDAVLHDVEVSSAEAASNILAGHDKAVSPTTIKGHRRKVCSCVRATEEAQAEPVAGKATVTSDGGSFENIETTEPISGDWTAVFRQFNLDPEKFVIVDDTVRMSTWQQSKRTDTGDRDIIQLYSYSARFTRKTDALEPERLDSLIASVRGWSAYPAPVMRPADKPVSLVVGLADWQLGKSESGHGTKQTLERLNESLTNLQAHIDTLRRDGINIQHLVLANLGDHIENVAGSYASQSYSVDLNMRDQLTLAIETNMAWIKALAPQFASTTYTACMCNHGQMSRGQGRDNVTDDADNATGFIGDTLRTVCNLHPDLAHLEWVIPRDEMITTFTASGVNIATAHGHKISGKEETWLAAQSQHLTHTRRFIPELWFTAHKHHASLVDLGPYTRIQATTVDPGSKWWTDASGMYSRPGVTSFLAGEHLPGKWSHYTIH
jgi:hypothetical protein